MDIYSSRIMELSTDITNIGPLVAIDESSIGRAIKISKICGSQISIELQFDKSTNRVSNFAIEPKACALGQASASILAKSIIGANLNEIKAARDGLYEMLKNGGDPPEGRFWEIRYLEPVTDYLPRHASVMLAWDAALAAIDDAIKQ